MSRLFVHLMEDDRERAEEALGANALTTVAGRVGYGSYLVGSGFAKLGKTEEAFRWLEQAVEQWFTNHRFMREHDPLLASLRETPRFEALLEKAREKEGTLDV